MENLLQHKLPVAPFVESTTNWITKTFSGLFDFIQTIGNALMDWMTKTLLFINPLLFIVLITIAVFFLAKKNGNYRHLLSLVCYLSITKGCGSS